MKTYTYHMGQVEGIREIILDDYKAFLDGVRIDNLECTKFMQRAAKQGVVPRMEEGFKIMGTTTGRTVSSKPNYEEVDK